MSFLADEWKKASEVRKCRECMPKQCSKFKKQKEMSCFYKARVDWIMAYVALVTGGVASVAIKKKATRHSSPIFGNWSTARQNFVAENAQGVDERVECGHVRINGASSRSRVKSLVLLLPRAARA